MFPLSIRSHLRSKLCAPILIPVQKCREDAVQVCASTNEQQYNKEKRLELEDAELDDYAVSK
jgi:hypothetical protein